MCLRSDPDCPGFGCQAEECLRLHHISKKLKGTTQDKANALIEMPMIEGVGSRSLLEVISEFLSGVLGWTVDAGITKASAENLAGLVAT